MDYKDFDNVLGLFNENVRGKRIEESMIAKIELKKKLMENGWTEYQVEVFYETWIQNLKFNKYFLCEKLFSFFY